MQSGFTRRQCSQQLSFRDTLKLDAETFESCSSRAKCTNKYKGGCVFWLHVAICPKRGKQLHVAIGQKEGHIARAAASLSVRLRARASTEAKLMDLLAT